LLLIALFCIQSLTVADSEKFLTLEYSLVISDLAGNVVLKGHFTLRADIDAKSVEVQGLAIDRSAISRALIERVIEYPDLSVYVTDPSRLSTASREKSLEISQMLCEYKGTTAVPLQDGSLIDAVGLLCRTSSGGAVSLKYERNTGILVQKELAFFSGGYYSATVTLLNRAPEMHLLSVSKSTLALFYAVSIVIALSSIAVFIWRDRYRVL